jgi:hypothetical protein
MDGKSDKRERSLAPLFIGAVLAIGPLIYVLIWPFANLLRNKGYVSPAVIDTIYAPVLWLYWHTEWGRDALNWYLGFFIP